MNTEPDNTAEISGELAATMPEVTVAETAPPPAAAPKPETAGPGTGIMHNGRLYDREKWLLNADGTLFLNRHGKPMPKGGRKPKGAETARPVSYLPPKTETGPKPETGNGETGNVPKPETEKAETGNGAKGEMPVASAKAVAECVTNAGYALTGALIRNPKAARPSPAEHANLRDTAAAYIDARGIRFAGAAAVAIGFIAYLLGEERRAAIWDAMKSLAVKLRKKPEKDVTPPAAVKTAATAKPEARPAETAGEFRPHDAAPFKTIF